MRFRKGCSWLTLVMFLLISSTAIAGDIQWLGLDGYLPGAGVESLTFQTADILDPAADIAGSLVVTAPTDGEIVKPLQVPNDFLLEKVHICFAAGNLPNGPVTVKLYQGSVDPLMVPAGQTQVVFQQDIPILPAVLAGCNEILVFNPADPASAIDPSQGPLYLGIGFVGTDSPVYLKAVGIEEFSDSFEIDECETGVMDRLLDSGQLLSAVVAECEAGPLKNHGQYVKCVSHTLNDLKKSGEITGREKGKIQRCAAKSDIGK